MTEALRSLIWTVFIFADTDDFREELEDAAGEDTDAAAAGLGPRSFMSIGIATAGAAAVFAGCCL